jgi:N-acetylneuraminate synthase
MNTYKKPYIIAEIGCNHKGDMEIAKELIKVAKIFCNLDAVKFQKRNNKELLTVAQYNQPHPNPVNSYGDTYGAHREYLEFDIIQHKALKAYCEEIGITYSTSVWDLTSAKEIASKLNIDGVSNYVRVSELKKQAVDKLIDSVDHSQVLDYL